MTLTRVTINLKPRPMAAMNDVMERTGESRTDVMNQSILIMQTLLGVLDRSGNGTLHVMYPDGTDEKIQLIW